MACQRWGSGPRGPRPAAAFRSPAQWNLYRAIIFVYKVSIMCVEEVDSPSDACLYVPAHGHPFFILCVISLVYHLKLALSEVYRLTH